MCDRSACLRHRPHRCGRCCGWWCGGRRKREGGRDARRRGLQCRFHYGLEASLLFLSCSSVYLYLYYIILYFYFKIILFNNNFLNPIFAPLKKNTVRIGQLPF
jgi:hypothetical protein